MVHTDKGPVKNDARDKGQWWEKEGERPLEEERPVAESDSEHPWWEMAEAASQSHEITPDRPSQPESGPPPLPLDEGALDVGFEAAGETPSGEISLDFAPGPEAFGEELTLEVALTELGFDAEEVEEAPSKAQAGDESLSISPEELAFLEAINSVGEGQREGEAAEPQRGQAEEQLFETFDSFDLGLELDLDDDLRLEGEDTYASLDGEDFELQAPSFVGQGREAPGPPPPVPMEEPEARADSLELNGEPEAINLRGPLHQNEAPLQGEQGPIAGELAIWEAPEEIGPLALLDDSEEGEQALTLPEGELKLSSAPEAQPLWQGGPEAAPTESEPEGELAMLQPGDEGGEEGALGEAEARIVGEGEGGLGWHGRDDEPLDLAEALSVTGQEGKDFIDSVPFDVEELGARFHRAALDPKRFKSLSIEEVFLMEVAALRGLPFTLEHEKPELQSPSPVAPIKRPRGRATGVVGKEKSRGHGQRPRRPLWMAGVGAALLLGVLAVPIPIAPDGGEVPLGEELLRDPEAIVDRIIDRLSGEEKWEDEVEDDDVIRTSRGVSVVSKGQDGGVKALSATEAVAMVDKLTKGLGKEKLKTRATTPGAGGGDAGQRDATKASQGRMGAKGKKGRGGGATLIPKLQHPGLSAHPDSAIHHLEDLLEDASHAQRNYDYRGAVELYEQALDSIGPTIPWEMRVAVWKGSREAFLLRAEVILKDEYLVKADCEQARSYLLRAEELGASSEQLNAYLNSAKRCFTGSGRNYRR